jgi:hypothetical protein
MAALLVNLPFFVRPNPELSNIAVANSQNLFSLPFSARNISRVKNEIP